MYIIEDVRFWLVAVVLALTARVALAAPSGTDVVIVVDRGLPAEKLAVVTQSLAGTRGSFDPKVRVAVVAAPAKVGGLAVGLRTAVDRLAGSRRSVKQILVVTDRGDLSRTQGILDRISKARITLSSVGYQSTNKLALTYLVRNCGTADLVDDTAALTEVLLRTRTGCPPEPPAETARSVVLVIDRSVSMTGRSLEAAKELARVWVLTLSPIDLVSVVTVDNESKVLLRPLRGTQRMKIVDAITNIDAGGTGPTNLFPALHDAFEIQRAMALRRQVVVISDGDSTSDAVVELVQDMHAAQITVSAVSLGGPDQELLRAIAGAGDGEFLVLDGRTIPRLPP